MAGTGGPDGELTEEQIARYDRQIRLWGYETQKRLMATEVYIVGVDAISMEAAKNLAAAGVNMAVVDERPYDGQLVNVIPVEDMFSPSCSSYSKWFVRGLRRMNALIQLSTPASCSKASAHTWILASLSQGHSLHAACYKYLLYAVDHKHAVVYVVSSPEDVMFLYENKPTPAMPLSPPMAAIVGGLIAQYVTNSINNKESQDWNTITFDLHDVSAAVQFTSTPTNPAPPPPPSLAAPIEQLDIDD